MRSPPPWTTTPSPGTRTTERATSGHAVDVEALGAYGVFAVDSDGDGATDVVSASRDSQNRDPPTVAFSFAHRPLVGHRGHRSVTTQHHRRRHGTRRPRVHARVGAVGGCAAARRCRTRRGRHVHPARRRPGPTALHPQRRRARSGLLPLHCLGRVRRGLPRHGSFTSKWRRIPRSCDSASTRDPKPSPATRSGNSRTPRCSAGSFGSTDQRQPVVAVPRRRRRRHRRRPGFATGAPERTVECGSNADSFGTPDAAMISQATGTAANDHVFPTP